MFAVSIIKSASGAVLLVRCGEARGKLVGWAFSRGGVESVICTYATARAAHDAADALALHHSAPRTPKTCKVFPIRQFGEGWSAERLAEQRENNRRASREQWQGERGQARRVRFAELARAWHQQRKGAGAGTSAGTSHPSAAVSAPLSQDASPSN